MKRLLISEEQYSRIENILKEVWSDDEWEQKKSEINKRIADNHQYHIRSISNNLNKIIKEYNDYTISNLFSHDSSISFHFRQFDFGSIIRYVQEYLSKYQQAIKKLKNIYKLQKDLSISDSELDGEIFETSKNLLERLQKETNVLSRFVKVFEELKSLTQNY